MNIWMRRSMIGVGAALLVGGWALTTMSAALLTNKSIAMEFYTWAFDAENRPRELTVTMRIDIAAVVAMALGAGMIGFGAIRTDKDTE